MLFVNETAGSQPSLVNWTRELAGDASASGSSQWSDNFVKEAVNRAYLDLREVARSYGFGATTKRSYATAVADQIYYQRPADLVRLEAVEISDNGSNLATASVSDADIIYAKPWTAEKALEAYNTGSATEVGTYVFLQDDHFGIIAPPSSTQAGTNTIRILYEASTAELTADGAEPEIFRPYHDLICYRAAIVLKISRDMDARDLAAIASEKEIRYRMACQDAMAMYEDKIATTGDRAQNPVITAGRIKRK